MTQENYRIAFEEANTELREIAARFDQLHSRKEQMELIVEALRPLLSDEPLVSVEQSILHSEPAPQLIQTMPEVIHEPVPEPVLVDTAEEPVEDPVFAADVSDDPFQRRIDNALRHGFGPRESRILPRALNGLLSRA